MAADDGEILGRFAHHPPGDGADGQERVNAHQMTREVIGNAAVLMNRLLPESREKSLCLTALQEACMWGNAAIALHFKAAAESGRAAR